MPLNIPSSRSEILENFGQALRDRSRSLNHGFEAVTCQLVREICSNKSTEKLETIFKEKRSKVGVIIRIDLWEDRWCVFDIRKGGKSGWLWEWTRDGRLSGAVTGAALLRATEETHKISHSYPDFNEDKAESLWAPILLTGPRLL